MLKTINVNPAVAGKASESVSIGLGLNIQHTEATLTNAISPLVPGSYMEVAGDDYGFGYNLGVLWQASAATRLGLAYRSEVSYTLKGSLTANKAGPGLPPSGDATTELTLPASASLSLVHQLTPSVELLADASWTGWSAFDRIAVVYSTLPVALPPTPENWKDTWRYSIGATWRANSEWSLRGGVAYDQTPVRAEFRTARIPDASRTWLAMGGQYRVSARTTLDFGYAHLFVKDATISSTTGAGTLTGSYSSSVNLLSAQVTHTF